MIGLPDPLSPTPPKEEFLIAFQSYGPLTIWSIIEFWIPYIQLFGYISIGTAMLIITLSFLMATSILLIALNSYMSKTYRTGVGLLSGSFISSLCTSLCSCCTPSALSLVIPLLSFGAVSGLSLILVNPSNPIYNVILIANILLLEISIAIGVRRLVLLHKLFYYKNNF